MAKGKASLKFNSYIDYMNYYKAGKTDLITADLLLEILKPSILTKCKLFLEHKKNYREVTERDIEWEIRCGDWQIFIPQMVKFFNWSIDHVYYRNYPLFADHNQSHEYGGVKNAIPKKYLPDIEAFLKIRFELGMTFKKAFQKFLRQKGVRIITKIEEIRIF